MTVPQLTPQQRADALVKAQQMRTERAALKRQLGDGSVTLERVRMLAIQGDQVVSGIRVSALLEALPRIGSAKREVIMATAKIADNRKVGGLGANQWTALLAAVEGLGVDRGAAPSA